MRLLLLWLAVEFSLRTTSVDVVARRFGAPLVRERRSSQAPVSPTTELSVREVRQLQIQRRVLALPFINGTCLRTSVMTGYILRERCPELVIGVRKTDGKVEAHAWIRVDGADLDLERQAGFEPLAFKALEAGRE
ncbi:lasso peptide biosynthesis B2 protein [Pseudactinotalea sp. Z1732]|uniref:lasso peptide biosynthesis B2 protein n=1 Tax=Micrococcales TaxID=85006 RepID=UPI003C7B51A6